VLKREGGEEINTRGGGSNGYATAPNDGTTHLGVVYSNQTADESIYVEFMHSIPPYQVFDDGVGSRFASIER
jgi:hypothetical protein